MEARGWLLLHLSVFNLIKSVRNQIQIIIVTWHLLRTEGLYHLSSPAITGVCELLAGHTANKILAFIAA